MRKNVASQVICAQLNATADGSAVTTGTTTVYVLGDGGTQGSGSGTVTHEGQGCWSYVPTQAETNYNHVAFTFVNSSAITQTVNVYPQVYDGTSGFLSVDVAGISGDTTASANAEAFFDGTGYAGTNNVIPTVTTVTNDVGVNEWNGVALGTTNPLPNAAAGAAGGLPTDSAGKTSFNDIAATAIVSGGAITTSGGAVSTVTTVTNDVGVNEWNGVALGTTNPLPNAAAGAAGGLPTDSTGKTSFNDITTAQVNAEVVDALVTDTYAEPGQGAPGATISLKDKIGYIYKFLRNKKTATSTTITVFNDDTTTAGQKSTISDDGTTYTEGEWTTGA